MLNITLRSIITTMLKQKLKLHRQPSLPNHPWQCHAQSSKPWKVFLTNILKINIKQQGHRMQWGHCCPFLSVVGITLQTLQVEGRSCQNGCATRYEHTNTKDEPIDLLLASLHVYDVNLYNNIDPAQFLWRQVLSSHTKPIDCVMWHYSYTKCDRFRLGTDSAAKPACNYKELSEWIRSRIFSPAIIRSWMLMGTQAGTGGKGSKNNHVLTDRESRIWVLTKGYSQLCSSASTE